MKKRKIKRYDDGGYATPVDTSSNDTGAGTGNYIGGGGNYGIDTSFNTVGGVDPNQFASAASNADSSAYQADVASRGSSAPSSASSQSSGALSAIAKGATLLSAIGGILTAAGHYQQSKAQSKLPSMPTLPGGASPLPTLPGQPAAGGSNGYGPAGGYGWQNYASMNAGTPGLGYAPRTQSAAQPTSSYYTYGAGPEQQFFQQVQPTGGPIAPVTHKHGGRITRKAHGGVARYDDGGQPELQTAQGAGIVPAPQQTQSGGMAGAIGSPLGFLLGSGLNPGPGFQMPLPGGGGIQPMPAPTQWGQQLSGPDNGDIISDPPWVRQLPAGKSGAPDIQQPLQGGTQIDWAPAMPSQGAPAAQGPLGGLAGALQNANAFQQLQAANASQQQAASIPGASGAPGALPPGTPGAANATQQQAAQAPSAGSGGALGSATPATASAPQLSVNQAMPGAPTPSQQTPTSQVAPQAQNIAPSVSSILGKPGIMGSMPSAGGAGMGGIMDGMMPRPGTPMPAASPAAGQMAPHTANPMENPARSGFAMQRPAWGRRTMMGRMAEGGTPEPPPRNPFINSNGQFIPQISQGAAQSQVLGSQPRGQIAEMMPKRFMQPAPGHAHGGALSGMPAAPKPSRHIQGPGDGTSDDIPARLANGEYVLSADVVSGIGNGDNGSGARKLDQFVHNLRVHKAQNASKGELPADAKPLHQYLGR